jgi:hypothetical protein
VLFIRGNNRDNSVNILRNLIRKYLSNPPDSRFQNKVSLNCSVFFGTLISSIPRKEEA